MRANNLQGMVHKNDLHETLVIMHQCTFKNIVTLNFMFDSPFSGTICMYSFVCLFKKYNLNKD